MSKPRLLDLFCGAGGVAKGYADAGFEVVGVDIEPQPRYPFEFVQADALRVLDTSPLSSFDAIHASPPCQAFTAMRVMWNAQAHPDLLTPVREALRRRYWQAGTHYVIENVEGAPMPEAVRLCGSSFGLGVAHLAAELRRHRLFECSFPVMVPPCYHAGQTIGFYGDHARDRRRGKDHPDKDKLALASEAMGIDWMTWKEITQAIPPAYTRFLGEQLLDALHLEGAPILLGSEEATTEVGQQIAHHVSELGRVAVAPKNRSNSDGLHPQNDALPASPVKSDLSANSRSGGMG